MHQARFVAIETSLLTLFPSWQIGKSLQNNYYEQKCMRDKSLNNIQLMTVVIMQKDESMTKFAEKRKQGFYQNINEGFIKKNCLLL